MRKLAFSERQIAFILVRESNVGRELSTATLLMQPALRTPDRRRAAVRCSALAAPGNGSDSTADPLRGGRTYGSIDLSLTKARRSPVHRAASGAAHLVELSLPLGGSAPEP